MCLGVFLLQSSSTTCGRLFLFMIDPFLSPCLMGGARKKNSLHEEKSSPFTLCLISFVGQIVEVVVTGYLSFFGDAGISHSGTLLCDTR
eukprot:UC4_evm3s506